MANRIQNAFDGIKADYRLKESTKRFLREQGGRTSCLYCSLALKYAVSAVCVILVLMMGAWGYSWIQIPISYVSIDVNPSIELALNRFDRVVEATAYNVEGEEILNDLSLKGKKYMDAIDTVMECDRMRPYLDGAAETVLTVAADERRGRELEMGVRRCAGHMGGGCHSDRADIETVTQAHESGVSVGKYNAYLRLSEYDGTVTVDECKEMSMAQIHEKIRECKRDGKGNGGGGNNSGCKNGRGDAGNEEKEDDGTSPYHKKRRHRRCQ